MQSIPQDVRGRVITAFEQNRAEIDPALRGQSNWGVYVGQSNSKIYFVPKQPVYKIGQTTDFLKRKPQLKCIHKILPQDLHFIEVLCNGMVEGTLHNLFRDVWATDYIRLEREWFYLSSDNVEWLHSFKAIDSHRFVACIDNLIPDLLDEGYTKTAINLWFRI